MQCMLYTQLTALDMYIYLYSCIPIAESMIKFKGRSSFKQYMPKKPVKRGYKVWILADKNGYCWNFDVYTGKLDNGLMTTNLGEKVVRNLTAELMGKNHICFFDNFFTSIPLMLNMKRSKIYACGTVNISRKFLPSFCQDRELKRGEHEWYSTEDLAAVKWKDKRCVHLLSTYHDPEQTVVLQRRNKNGSLADVTAPQMLKDYNSNMNYVDRFDQLLSSYKCDRKSKKWWHRIFFYFLDVCVVNSYILYKLACESPHDHKNFRLDIVQGLLAETIISRNIKRQSTSTQLPVASIKKSKPYVPQHIRTTEAAHQPQRSTRRRCALCSTTKKEVRTDWICNICNVPLCLTKSKTCFQDYHNIGSSASGL